MSLRKWAIKRSELKALDGAARLRFLSRVAQRVQPWAPNTAREKYVEGLALLMKPDPRPNIETHARELQDLGALACHQLYETDDEALGRCNNYATLVLANALRTSTLDDMTDGIIDVAKHAGSTPPIWVRANGGDVETAALQMWNAMRADLANHAKELPLWEEIPNWLSKC